MNKIIGLIALFGLLTGCNTSNHQSSNSRITLSQEPQTYIKDRKLYGSIEQSVDPQGAAGPGSGSSYASRSYRQASIKNFDKINLQGDTTENKIQGYVRPIFPTKNEANINYIDRWDRNLINKYNMNKNNPDTTSLHSCYWRPPLRENYCSIR